MLNEFIMLWLAEFGMEWVHIRILGNTEWGHAFAWRDAREVGAIERHEGSGQYRLTQKAIHQLTKEQ